MMDSSVHKQLHFKSVNAENRREVEGLTVFSEQAGFIESVSECLREADELELWRPVGMEGANIRNMLRIFGGDPEGKVAKLLSYAGSERDISDPWYTGDFGTTYDDVLEGCTAFLEYLQQNSKIDT